MSAAKYYIYRNLHTGGFSVKHRGIVVARDNCFTAVNVSFKVNEIGRQRVLKEKRKSVHAYTVSDKYIFASSTECVDKLPIITYNPYKSANFTCNKIAITNAQKVLFKNGKCYLIE